MIRQLFMGIALLAAAGFQAAGYFMPAGGHPADEIAGRLPVIFMPARFSAVLLLAVYPLLALWVLRFRKGGEEAGLLNLRAGLFIGTCLAQVAKLVAWQDGHFSAAILAGLLQVLLLAVLYFSYPRRLNSPAGRIPVSALFSWSLFCLLAIVHYTLEFHDWNGFGLSDPLWAILTNTFAAAVALHFLHHYGDRTFALVFAWNAAMVAFHNLLDEPFVTAASLFLAGTAVVWTFLDMRKPVQRLETAENE
ncbi:hypothetical protein ACFFIY_09880 [Bhargavaea ullalensis]|uniref:Steroid 5-alpha reductase C-terminal domain-containing protein n=1 Tax=Bhargavaea ullalensis TaxID=1265685 RepID=A0ABV2GDB6_9BACL